MKKYFSKENIKFFFNKNNFIILSLLIVFIIMINYENIIFFLNIKEGNDENEFKRKKKESLEKINNLKNELITTTENGSGDKIFLSDFLTDDRKGKIKEIFKLSIEDMLKYRLKKTYSEFLEDYKVKELTYSQHKTNIEYLFTPFGLSPLLIHNILKDMNFDLLTEIENIFNNSSNSNSNSIMSANPVNLTLNALS